ncbi:MAG: iron ABC transporter permease [Planctomycetes bacterium]|nr:iron ABC transporter permease [Planctomycetota bacterium]
MTGWRLGSGAGLILVVALPLLFPFFEQPPWHWLALDSAEFPRLGSLAWNSIVLVAGVLALALPLGTLLAVLLFRTDLPLRRAVLFATVLLVFIPVAVQVSAWQGLLGNLRVWDTDSGRPWARGMMPAIWVHAVAALPWVVLIVGIGLAWVERELEEQALLSVGPWRVLWHVTLPRCRGAIAAAAFWVAVLTAGDISATDMFLVPTFAEEMQTQFTLGGPESVTNTLRLCWPALAIMFILLVALTPRIERAMPPLQNPLRPPVLFSLGRMRYPWLSVVLALAIIFLILPLGALAWKLGQAGQPRSWSAENAWLQLRGVAVIYGRKVLLNVGVAAFTGIVTTGIALIACWLSRESRIYRTFLLTIMAWCWTLPGPLAGVGLQSFIQMLVQLVPGDLAFHALYYDSSPLPIIWVNLIRFLPFAVALLWPAIRMVPTELRDAARLEGASAGQELLHVYLPLTKSAFFGAAVAVAALSLGEVGATARVDTPGWDSFAKLIFDRMHYGVENNVAALCLLLVGAVSLAYLIGAVGWRVFTK